MKKLKKPKSPSPKSLKPLKKPVPPVEPVSLPGASTTASPLTDGTAQFEKAIQESQAKLAEESEPKRPVGRPRKNTGGAPEVLSEPNGPLVGSAGTGLGAPSSYPPGTTTVLWKIGSKLAASRTGFKDWACDDEECQALDEAAVPVLNRYFPPALAEASPLITFSFTLCAVFGMKSIAYFDWKREQAAKDAPKAGPPPGEPSPIALPVNPLDGIRR